MMGAESNVKGEWFEWDGDTDMRGKDSVLIGGTLI